MSEDNFKAAPVPGEFTLSLNEAEYFALSAMVAKNCSDLLKDLGKMNAKSDGIDGITNAQAQRYAATRLTESVLRSVQNKLKDAS